MPIQSALAQVGVAKQTAKGTAATNPTFGHGVTDGVVLSLEIAQDAEEQTSAARASKAVNRTSVVPGMDFTGRAHPKSVGLYTFGALGAVATTGAGPYTHTITLADALPYLSGFGRLGSNIYRVQDLKVDSLGFSWNADEALSMAVKGMGTTVNYAATFTPTTDESIGTDAKYFRASSGTFKLDVKTATPATAPITAGEITISNNLSTIQASGSISPSDVFEGRTDIECSFDVVVEDLTDWRAIATGSTTGTTATDAPLYGSFEINFTNGTDALKFTATKVAFLCDFPSADPAGGPVTLTFAGIVVRPDSGSLLTVALTNSQASY